MWLTNGSFSNAKDHVNMYLSYLKLLASQISFCGVMQFLKPIFYIVFCGNSEYCYSNWRSCLTWIVIAFNRLDGSGNTTLVLPTSDSGTRKVKEKVQQWICFDWAKVILWNRWCCAHISNSLEALQVSCICVYCHSLFRWCSLSLLSGWLEEQTETWDHSKP